MLLSLMRKNAKSWIIKFLMVIIAVVFVFYFGYTYTSQESAKVATVNGEVITRQEYQNAYYKLISNLQDQYKDAWNDNLIKTFNLERSALESLIQQKLIYQEAKRVGLDITDKEIQDTISKYPAFQTGGRFDNTRYNAMLAKNRMTTEEFEASISQSLLEQKLVQFLTTFLVLSDQEVKNYYIYENEMVKVSFVNFSGDQYISSITIDELLMDKYFEEHKNYYSIPPMIKISYIYVSPDQFKDQVELHEEDIKVYYEDNMDLFKEEKEVKASHILFYLNDEDPEEKKEAIKERASSVLEMAREGKDFAMLAMEYSEDTATKEDGGSLGYFKEGQMVKAFEDAAFSLKKGEVSDLVRTSYGYHIIKVEDIKEERVKDLQEVHDQIEDVLINNESKDLANESILTLLDHMPYDAELVEYAEENGVTVITTDYFSEYDPVPFLYDQTKMLNMIFSMQNNEVSDVIEINDKFYIIQVVDKKSSYTPDIEEVSALVEEDYRAYLAVQKAKASAEEYLARLKGGVDWNDLARERGMTPQTTDFFTRLDLLDSMEYNNGLQKEAFKLSSNNRYPDSVIEHETGAYVIRWEEEKEIDEEKYREEKDTYAGNILLTKQQYIFSSWLDRLKENADIESSDF